jgi:hypothetical protein
MKAIYKSFFNHRAHGGFTEVTENCEMHEFNSLKKQIRQNHNFLLQTQKSAKIIIICGISGKKIIVQPINKWTVTVLLLSLPYEFNNDLSGSYINNVAHRFFQ